ncbi:MAG: 3-isopropylmalate dehydratase small subunit [Bdellovibrionales bacterium]
MRPFTQLTSVAASLPMVNVDTDAIIPKQFLKTIRRSGLGRNLFYDLRYLPSGDENPDFALNKPDWKDARILIAGANFGCGSSREHAPWALEDYGIRCVIAPSFADIFYNNCFKNGLLPLVLPQEQVDSLMARAQAKAVFTIDLEQQIVSVAASNERYAFTIDPFLRHCLLEGLDEIGLTEQHVDDIAAFEQRREAERAWL